MTQTIPSSQIDAINDDIKPVVETTMEKGKATQDKYKKFSADEKARVAKLAAEYGVFSTVQNFNKICIWPDWPLKKKPFLLTR